MPEKISALYSDYTIDGVQQEATPAEMLDALVCEGSGKLHQGADNPAAEIPDKYFPVIDETIDPVVCRSEPAVQEVPACAEAVLSFGGEGDIPLFCADAYTRCHLASAVISTLWKKGSFRLGDLALGVEWKWNPEAVGAMAAFYESVRGFADYADALGLPLRDYRFSRSKTRNALAVKAFVSDSVTPSDSLVPDDAFDLEDNSPSREDLPKMVRSRACPPGVIPKEDSWVVYIPFDTADFRLGGSVLARKLGLGGAPVDVSDADYFIDCYEVVREFVEDGVLLSGVTVCDGGLFAAVSRACAAGGCGLRMDVSDILRAYGESSLVKVLFSEVPGVVVQISDADFDYLDAELLLQDVAYFPLGHPMPCSTEVTIKASAKSGIQTILESLLRNAEGED